MTSKVTIETTRYPVLVEELPHSANNPQGIWKGSQVVQPQSRVDITLCFGNQLKITELPAYPEVPVRAAD